MYKKLLIPLDGSPSSETVLPYARSLARRLRLPVEFLLVTDRKVTELAHRFSGHCADPETWIRQNRSAYLERVAERFPSAPHLECSVEIGNPAELILARASKDREIMITMASRGYSAASSRLLGSVAYKVASATKNPLLLIPAVEGIIGTAGEAELKSLLVALDGSDRAEAALPHAVLLAKNLLLDVVLVHVTEPLNHTKWNVASQLPKERKAAAGAYLEIILKKLRDAGVEKPRSLILEGDPAAEIVNAANSLPNAMIALTTHGKSGITRWVLGSVSERVIRHADRPVFLEHDGAIPQWLASDIAAASGA
jgi:nucleotide-binding universal stress UspA family protein